MVFWVIFNKINENLMTRIILLSVLHLSIHLDKIVFFFFFLFLFFLLLLCQSIQSSGSDLNLLNVFGELADLLDRYTNRYYSSTTNRDKRERKTLGFPIPNIMATQYVNFRFLVRFSLNYRRKILLEFNLVAFLF